MFYYKGQVVIWILSVAVVFTFQNSIHLLRPGLLNVNFFMCVKPVYSCTSGLFNSRLCEYTCEILIMRFLCLCSGHACHCHIWCNFKLCAQLQITCFIHNIFFTRSTICSFYPSVKFHRRAIFISHTICLLVHPSVHGLIPV